MDNNNKKKPLIRKETKQFQQRLSRIENEELLQFQKQQQSSSYDKRQSQNCILSPIQNQRISYLGQKKLSSQQQLQKDTEQDIAEKFNYDPYKQPPDFEMAYLHKQARRVGIVQEKSQNMCPCCNNYYDKKLVKLNCLEKDMAFLGSGYSLFFRLSKYFGLIILILFFISGSFIQVFTSFNCTKNCVYFIFIPVMDLDKLENELKEQTITNIFVGVVMMVIIIYIKPFIFENIFEYNDNFISPSHYTICIKNLPIDTTKQQLKDYFEELTNNKVVKVNFAYDISDFTESFKSKIENLRLLKTYQLELKQCQEQLQQNDKKVNQKEIQYQQDRLKRNITVAKNTLRILDERLKDFQKDCQHPKSSKFLGSAFISFQNQLPVRCIVEQWGQTTWRSFQLMFFGCFTTPYMKFNNRVMIIVQPGAPTDVIWENLEYQFIKVVTSHTIMILGSFALLAASFSLQFWIMKYVYPYKKESFIEDDIAIKLIAITLSLIVVLINLALRLLVFQFTKLIKFDSITELYQAYINRYIFLYFANSAFIPYFVHAIFDQEDDNRSLLVQDIHFIMLASSFSTPLSKIFEIDIAVKLFLRRQMNKYKQEESPYTQHEANEIMEDYVIDIADSYAFISRTLFLCAWYAVIAPVGILFGLAALALNYWIDKYQLLRMQSQPQSINEKVIKSVLNVIEIVPILYILGAMQYQNNIIASVYDFVGYGKSYYILGVFFFGFFIFGRQKVPRGKMDKLSYDQVRLQFRTEYDACNPITKFEANKDWIRFLYNQNYINRKEKDKLIKQSEELITKQNQLPNTFINKEGNITPRAVTVENTNLITPIQYNNNIMERSQLDLQQNMNQSNNHDVEMVDLQFNKHDDNENLIQQDKY